ncbi:MAG TPA: type II secretion system protein [Clostridia bacterium]|nr:type II secretion system protein [Clostridia bacterium]
MIQTLIKKIGKDKKGFTLIELLVVIAILGILAAILIPTVSGYINSARDSVATADARTVYSAVSAYTAAHSDVTYTAYVDSNKPATGASETTIYKDDLNTYLGTHSFSIAVTIPSGSPTIVTVTESNGRTGTYTKS